MTKKLSCLLLFLFSPLMVLFSSYAHALEINYTLSIQNPVSHYFLVDVEIRDWNEDQFEFQFPAWSPGRYTILNFAKNVRSFRAKSAHSNLITQKIDKQTWRVNTQNTKNFTLSYSVFANTLSGDYSQLNEFHALVDGASIFGYVHNHKHHPVSLKVNYPAQWEILSSAGDLGQATFRFPHYDRMIDELIQLGEIDLHTFTVDGIECRVSIVHKGDGKHISEFIENLKKIAQTAMDFFPALDTKRLTLFFHFLPHSRNTAGMEHLNSIQVTRNHKLDAYNTSMDWTYWIAAHEFVHFWNVKRLRPQGLGPFDYTKEVYTPLLWFGEGSTSFLADIIMLHSGLWTENFFLDRLASNIDQFRSTPGIFERSAEEASFDTWLIDDSPNTDWNNVWVTYYLKGQLISYCIDLEIRHLTQNQKSFFDFFNLMYHRFYQRATPDSYYIKGRAFTNSDILNALEETTSTPWNAFYQDLIQRPGDINFDYYLSLGGMFLDKEIPDPPVPYTGLRLKNTGGFPQIHWIEDRSPAQQSGLDRDDTLVALNDTRLSWGNHQEIIAREYQKAETILVRVLRDEHFITIPLKLNTNWMQYDYEITLGENDSTFIYSVND